MTLEEIRAEIDKLDNEIKELFVKRMECAKHVAEVKSASGGDVYAPAREREILERRSSDIDAEIREEYTAFQKHLMSVCRRYEYGLLDRMQEQVTADALEEAGLTADTEHSGIVIGFSCSLEESDLNLFVNMAKLNRVGIQEMQLEIKDGRQQITMTLSGNVKDGGMKRLLCQIGKEAEDFRIIRLEHIL
jgi:chorismate mutase